VSDLWATIRARLDPIASWSPERAAAQSDFDLSPEFRPTGVRALRQAAVLVPIVDRPEGATLLLTRRTDHLTKHAGQIAFPGGRLDPGEGPVEAAVREAEEEIGLDPAFVEPLALSTPYETITGYAVTPVAARVRPGFDLRLNPEEVADAFEAPWPFFMDEANHERRFFETGGARRWYWAMPWEDRFVWGATAGMLRALWARLQG
jgi:8-oxo-dGTP pyrophosphatase MutT (NUDIX family)